MLLLKNVNMFVNLPKLCYVVSNGIQIPDHYTLRWVCCHFLYFLWPHPDADDFLYFFIRLSADVMLFQLVRNKYFYAKFLFQFETHKTGAVYGINFHLAHHRLNVRVLYFATFSIGQLCRTH